MPYTPPVDTIAATWVGANPYGAASARIFATWDDSGALYASLAGIRPGGVGTPRLNDQIEPIGITPHNVGAARALHPGDYSTPQFLLNASWVGKNPYSGRGSNVLGSWSSSIEILPVGFTEEAFSDPVLTWQLFADPEGFDNLLFSVPRHVTHKDQYREPFHTLNASWVGAAVFTPSVFGVSASWAGTQQLFPIGVDESAVSEPVLLYTQFIEPSGVDTLRLGSDVSSLFWYQYNPPTFTLNASWVGKAEFVPKGSPNVHGWWTVEDGSLVAGVLGWNSATFGTATARNQREYVLAQGNVFLAFGTPNVWKDYKQIIAVGFNASAMGTGHLLSWRKFITPPGGVRTSYGTAKVEFLNRTVQPSGMNTAAFGTQRVVNSTRYLSPPGGVRTSYGAHNVALRVRYVSPNGFLAARYGQATSIANATFDQLVRPSSLQASLWGFAHVELWERYVLPPSMPSVLQFGNQTELYNFDRQITTFGTQFWRVGTPALEEVNFTRELKPAPILGGIGTPSVANRNRQIRVESWVSSAFAGLNTTIAIDEFGKLRARSIDPPVVPFGTPRLDLYSRYVIPSGWVAWSVGTPRLEYRIRPIAPAGFVATSYGTQTLSHGLRYITVPTGISGGIGAPNVQLLKRYIFTLGSITVRWGVPVMGIDLTVSAAGFNVTRYGVAWVHDNTQFIEPPGFAGKFGVALLTRNPRHITAPSLPSPSAVFSPYSLVWNRRQYIEPFTDTATTWGPWFGSTIQMMVWNKNRQITGIGSIMSRVPIGAIVYNNARVVSPAGIASLQIGAGTFIADAVRYLAPPAMEPTPILRWTTVHNDARVLAPSGIDALPAGTQADVRNINREIKHYSGHIPDSVFGTAFIADAVREITFYAGIWSQAFGFGANVYNYASYLWPTGIFWPDGTGAHDVHEHFNIIGPVRTVVQTRYGEAWVRNKTPQLYAYGHDSATFGATQIRLEYRFVLAQSPSRMDLYGRPIVRDKRTWVTVPGFNALRHGLQLVKLANPDLPWPQVIDLDEYGYGPPQGWWGGGANRVWANSLYPGWLSPSSRFGTPEVYLQGIRAPSIIPAENWAMQFGLVWVNPWFLVSPTGIAPIMPRRTDPGTSFTGDGPTKHRVTPHTIWCAPATTQAEQNHNDRVWARMDQAVQPSYSGPRWPWWGRPRVENYHRSITQGGSANLHARYGSPNIKLMRRYVLPAGYRVFRVGTHELFGGSRDIKAWGLPLGSVGTAHKVEHYVPPFITRTVRPAAFLAYANGANRVELKNRTLLASPTNPLAVPQPMVSRSPRWLTHGGSDYTAFGTLWISHYTRYIEAEGFDLSIILGYSYENFSWRLRVRQRFMVAASAGVQTTIGQATVSNAMRTVAPTDEIAPGGVGRPRIGTFSAIALGGFGFDSSAFGDVDEWEANRIKPHGDDLSHCGIPRINRVISASGQNGDAGVPRLGRVVYGAGFGAAAMGQPATPMLNPHICGLTARAVVPWAFVPPAVGTPSMS